MLNEPIESLEHKKEKLVRKVTEGNLKHNNFYGIERIIKDLFVVCPFVLGLGYLIGFSSTGKTNPKEWEDYIKRTKNQAIENAQYRKEVNASYNSIFKDKDSLDVYLGNQELKKYIQLNPVFSFDIKERAVIENRKMSIKDKLNR